MNKNGKIEPIIIDIRGQRGTKLNSTSEGDRNESNLKNSLIIQILNGLIEPTGKHIPTVVLYDDKGLQIFDQLTCLDEYYIGREEISILEQHSHEIISHIPNNSAIIELGAGSLKKTKLLLDSLEKKHIGISYYALDLMRDELIKSLVNLGDYSNVKTIGLWGTYDDGMKFLKSLPFDMPKTLLWLGSSLGNCTKTNAHQIIESYKNILNSGDTWLIGIEKRNSPEEIMLAYHDSKGLTRDFILNGLDHVNLIMGQELLNPQNFDYYGTYNNEEGRHEAYYKALHPQLINITFNGKVYETEIKKGELINVEYSYKYSSEEAYKLFKNTKMNIKGEWESSNHRYVIYMIQVPAST